MSESNPNSAVGLVGVGRLGIAMARNLIERGHRVVGYRRSAMNDLVAAGGEAADSPAAVARAVDVVLTCLPDGSALDQAMEGASGLAAGLRPGQAVFDLGTYELAAKERAQAMAAEKGAALLDCAVSGNPSFVRARSAALFASGDAAAFGRHRAILADITDNVAFVGGFGAGTALKLIAALLVPVHTLAAAEAMSLATRAGIDRQVVYDAIAGTPASSGMFETRGKAMVAGEHGTTSTMAGYLKNVSMAMELAERLGGELPLLQTMYRVYREAVAAGFGARDQSTVFDYLMRERGDG